MSKESFEYGGYHFIPERNLTVEENDFCKISRKLYYDEELVFIKKVMFVMAKSLIYTKASMELLRIKGAIYSAVWKTDGCISLARTNYFSMENARRSVSA